MDRKYAWDQSLIRGINHCGIFMHLGGINVCQWEVLTMKGQYTILTVEVIIGYHFAGQ